MIGVLYNVWISYLLIIFYSRSSNFILSFVFNDTATTEIYTLTHSFPTRRSSDLHLVRDVLSDKARIQSVHHRTLVREGEIVACPRRRRSSHVGVERREQHLAGIDDVSTERERAHV